MHQHIAHSDHRLAHLLRQNADPVETDLIPAVIARGGPQEALTGEGATDGAKIAAGAFRAGIVQRVGRKGDQHHALAPFDQIGALQVTFALGRAPLANRQKPGQARPGGKIGGQGQPFHGGVSQHQTRPGDQFRQRRVRHGGGISLSGEMRHGLAAGMVRHALRADDWARLCRRGPRLVAQTRQFLQRGEGPHHACHRIAIGDGDGTQPQFCRPRYQFLWMRGAGQEGEVRCDAKFGVGNHANSPCTCQFCAPPGAGQSGVCGV